MSDQTEHVSLTRQNRRDLERFRDTLRAIPRRQVTKKFFMGNWASQEEAWGEKNATKDVAARICDPNCGTSACALGWAATIPAFRRRGLEFEANAHHSEANVRFGDAHGTVAGEQFFGINEDAAEWLFLPSKYAICTDEIRPHMVVKRIDYLLKHDGKVPSEFSTLMNYGLGRPR